MRRAGFGNGAGKHRRHRKATENTEGRRVGAHGPAPFWKAAPLRKPARFLGKLGEPQKTQKDHRKHRRPQGRGEACLALFGARQHVAARVGANGRSPLRKPARFLGKAGKPQKTQKGHRKHRRRQGRGEACLALFGARQHVAARVGANGRSPLRPPYVFWDRAGGPQKAQKGHRKHRRSSGRGEACLALFGARPRAPAKPPQLLGAVRGNHRKHRRLHGR